MVSIVVFLNVFHKIYYCVFLLAPNSFIDNENETSKSVNHSSEKTPLLGHLRPMYIGAGNSIPKLVLGSLLVATLVVSGYLFFEEGKLSAVFKVKAIIIIIQLKELKK